MNKYFELDMPEMWWIKPQSAWIDDMVLENKLCSVCHRLVRGWFPTPIDVRYGRPIKQINIHECSVTNIALIDKRLLERLRPWIESEQWAIGRALDKDGNEVVTHATCYTEPVVQVRNGKPSDIRVCVECGTIRVGRLDPYHPEYLLAHDVAERAVVMDRIGTIYVREDAAKSLDLSDLKPMYLTPIDVFDAPRDGLRFPGDPPAVSGVDARISWNPKVDPPWDHLPVVGG